jgi:PAS domain S-box-containing protein
MEHVLNILHIEDSQADFLLIERHLAQHGMIVRCTRVDSLTGLTHALAAERWDLIISDFSVPTLDFYDSFAHIQARAPELPVILVSGSIGEEQAVEILRLGVWDFILKDNLSRLTSAIERCLMEAKERAMRKVAESAMRESEYRFRSMFNNSPIAIGIGRIDDGRLIDVNEAWLHLFGFQRDEVIERTITELNLYVRADERAGFVNIIHECGRIVNKAVLMRRKSGDIVDVLYSAELIVLDGDVYLQAMMTDITEQRRIEEQLRQSQKMEAAGQLAGGVAHDFNNILQVIMGNSQLQMMYNEEQGVDAHYLTEVFKAVERGSSLTRSLLVFCRKQPLEFTTFNLNELVRESHKLAMRLVTEEIAIHLELDDQALKVTGDSGLMQNVIFNLVTNARDAITRQGSITIFSRKETVTGDFIAAHGVASHEGNYAVLSVGDTGSGIDDGIRSKIFEPFFTTKDAGKGTGLGLSMIYGTIQQMGGFVAVNSRLGMGTTFDIYVPLAEDSEITKVAAVKNEAALGNGELVLIVEDEEGVRNSLAQILTISGYRVICAANGNDAIKLGRENSSVLKLVIMDMILPDLNGLETAKILKLGNSALPVIFVSGYDELNTEAAGVADCQLRKPVHPSEMLKHVRRLLDESHAK